MENVNMTSENIENDNLDKLRNVFPEFVRDGIVDFDALKVFFTKEGIFPDGQEKYGLNWAGKSNAFKLIKTPVTGTLALDEKESNPPAGGSDKTENIFIEGDNLEVLKLLQKHYREQIKMIYIDPPYNTGKDFIYKDNFTEDKSDYYERTGQNFGGIPMTTNRDSSGRYHSDWLTMMYPRLFLARNLLREDGVIFISIDDNEVANLRMIMDEIFGEENLIAQIVWERSYSPVNAKKYFSENHEYVLAYSKNIESLAGLSLKRTDDANSRYDNPDNDARGVWKSSDFSVGPVNQNNLYGITVPSGRKVNPPKGRSWVVSEVKFQELVSDGRIWFGKDGNNVPSQKRFITEVQDGMTPTTLWKYKEVGHTQDARKETKYLFDGAAYFDYPKPVTLIKRILELSTLSSGNDLVLDFFSGSGTTAHAVMALNAEDGGNRKWICVQLPEMTDENSEARKAGFENIAQIARERIRRAGDKIAKEYHSKLTEGHPELVSGSHKLDLGFKAYTLSKSNYREWNVLDENGDSAKLKEQLKLIKDKPLVDNFDEKSVVYEIMTKEGLDLNSSVIASPAEGGINSAKQSFWTVTSCHSGLDPESSHKMIISFADKLTQEQADSFGLSEGDLFVCLDSALDDTTKVNILRRKFNVKVV